MPFKIAIIGAGPAGCTLARLLTCRTACEVVVFEAEAGADVRSQGGTLDLRGDGGLRALREAGLWEEFRKYARYDGEALLITDKQLKAWVKMVPLPFLGRNNSRPEIDRKLLRTMLYESLPTGMVRWDHKVVRVEGEKQDSYSLQFANGTSSGGFDLVVGADGAWSKARTALTDVRPYYYGIRYVSMVVDNVEQEHPDLYQLVNRGSVFSYSDGKSITAQYLSDGSLSVGAGWLSSEKEDDVENAATLKMSLSEEYADWSVLLRKCISASNEQKIQPRALYMLPVDHTWTHKKGITLIGDAAHLMTPYAGIGVNVAMHDAVMLSKAIKQAEKQADADSDILDGHVRRFEENMFSRMHAAQELSWHSFHDMFFVPGAPRASIQDYIGRIVVYEMGRVVGGIFRLLIRTVYVVLKWFR